MALQTTKLGTRTAEMSATRFIETAAVISLPPPNAHETKMSVDDASNCSDDSMDSESENDDESEDEGDDEENWNVIKREAANIDADGEYATMAISVDRASLLKPFMADFANGLISLASLPAGVIQYVMPPGIDPENLCREYVQGRLEGLEREIEEEATMERMKDAVRRQLRGELRKAEKQRAKELAEHEARLKGLKEEIRALEAIAEEKRRAAQA